MDVTTPLAARPVRFANVWALLIFALLAVLAGILATATGNHVASAQPAHIAQEAPAAPSAEQQRMATLMGEGVGYSTEQAEALAIAADLVCEGITAQAPMVEMGNFLVADYGLTDDEARHFITVIADTHC